MMNIKPTKFEDVKIIESNSFSDQRGSFTKVFNDEDFGKMGLHLEFQEIYYSVSQKNVIRGMHFQLPPYEHDKLVHVISGSVIDVVVDLRKDSPHYKEYLAVHLTDCLPTALYIPKGFAHGFKSLEDNTIMLYQVTSGYQPQCDSGIAYDSIGYDWGIEEPILSERDRQFIALDKFESPF